MSVNEGRTLTVLAVDDSPVMHATVKRALGGEYRVLVKDNALDALSLIYHEPISVLLLDVTMPEIDGLELCRTVRNLPQFQKLPIIIITARNKAFDKVKGRMAGATEYLTKPFDDRELRQIVDKYAKA